MNGARSAIWQGPVSAGCVRDLVGIAPPTPAFDGESWPARVFELREQMHALRLALGRIDDPEPRELAELADELIELSGRLLALYADTAGQVGAWAYDIRARFWSTLGDLSEKWEEILSREDVTWPERAADGLSFVLARLGDTGYVQSAWAAHRASTAALRLEVSDELWQWLPRWLGPSAEPKAIAALTGAICAQAAPSEARPEEVALRVMALRAALLARGVSDFRPRLASYCERHAVAGG